MGEQLLQKNNKERQNLAILVWALRGGGAERIVGMLSEALSDYYKVYLFLVDKEQITYEYAGEIVAIYDEFPGQTVCEALYNCKGKYQIDVAISFLDVMNLDNIRSRRGEKVIISSRCSYKPWLKDGSYLDRNIREYYSQADRIITCSIGLKVQLEEYYNIENDKIISIYNFINTERILEKSKEKTSEDFNSFIGQSQYFISVGRLDRQKNQEQLIRQFGEFIRESKGDYKLVIIGSGADQEKLEKLIFSERLTENVLMIPYCDNPFPYVKGALSFVFPSNYEGLPNALLEAMTLGIPVIATDCLTGPREILLDSVDYKQNIEEMVVTPRGLLIGKRHGDEDFTNANIKIALKWVVEHKEELGHISAAEKNYISAYNSCDYTKQWIDAITEDTAMSSAPDRKVFEEIREKVASSKKVYIYGAGRIGRRVFNSYNASGNVEAFLVTHLEKDDIEYMGIPVIQIDKVDICEEGTLVLVGVGISLIDEVCAELENRGCMNYVIP